MHPPSRVPHDQEWNITDRLRLILCTNLELAVVSQDFLGGFHKVTADFRRESIFGTSRVYLCFVCNSVRKFEVVRIGTDLKVYKVYLPFDMYACACPHKYSFILILVPQHLKFRCLCKIMYVFFAKDSYSCFCTHIPYYNYVHIWSL